MQTYHTNRILHQNKIKKKIKLILLLPAISVYVLTFHIPRLTVDISFNRYMFRYSYLKILRKVTKDSG